MAERILVVNADDFGANRPRNDGILQARARGVVTSASVLATHPATEDAAARGPASGLGLGLHLNLSEGAPLAPGHRTLAGPDGRFRGKAEARAFFAAGKADPAEVAREIEAQLAWLEARGIRPTHVDGHHHIHIYPGVIGPLSEAMRRRGLRRIRLPSGVLDRLEGMPADRGQAMAEYAALMPAALRTARDAGLRPAEGFLGISLTGRMRAASILEALSRAPEGVTELMTHPGFADPAAGVFSGPDRDAEVAVLTDPALREGIARMGFRLAHFGELS